MKNAYALLLLMLTFCACSSTKLEPHENAIPLHEQFVKAKITKTADISFGSLNTGWNSNNSEKQDSLRKAVNNYPNPFSPPTVLYFTVAQPDSFSIDIHDINYNLISYLFEGKLSRGHYKISFTQSHINSGVFIVSIKFGEEKYFRKIMFLK